MPGNGSENLAGFGQVGQMTLGTISGLISRVKLPNGDVYSIRDSAATNVTVAGSTDSDNFTLFVTNPMTNGDEVSY